MIYSADDVEPHLTCKGVHVHYLLVSDNAVALSCKHHENGSETQQTLHFCPKCLTIKVASLIHVHVAHANVVTIPGLGILITQPLHT